MSYSKSDSKERKNARALFSVICLCVISLGLIVYFSTNSSSGNNAVNENTTLVQTTEVQRAVTVKETRKSTTAAPSTTKAAPSTTEKPSMPLSKSNTPYKSYYKYPLSEVVLKGYSEELTKSNTMGDYRSHAGVDFKGNERDDVVAINDGIVLDVYEDAMYGMTVEIDHGGRLVAKYSGLGSVLVKKGDYVNIGGKIATLGSVPCEAADGTHLHLSCTLKGKPVNPLDVMGKTE